MPQRGDISIIETVVDVRHPNVSGGNETCQEFDAACGRKETIIDAHPPLSSRHAMCTWYHGSVGCVKSLNSHDASRNGTIIVVQGWIIPTTLAGCQYIMPVVAWSSTFLR